MSGIIRPLNKNVVLGVCVTVGLVYSIANSVTKNTVVIQQSNLVFGKRGHQYRHIHPFNCQYLPSQRKD